MVVRAASVLLLVLAFLAPAWAGGGRAHGGRLDLTVLFQYEEEDMDGWRACFDEVSAMLQEATEGRFRLGNVVLTTNEEASNGADVVVSEGPTPPGPAHVVGMKATMQTGLGQPDTRVQLYPRHKGEPKTILHELGHYVFILYDEYKGQRWSLEDGQWRQHRENGTVWLKSEGRAAANRWFCSHRGEVGASCLMDASSAWKSSRSAFCRAPAGEAQHVASFRDGPLFFRSDQQVMHNGRDCWSRVVALSEATQGRAEGTSAVTVANDALHLLLLETSEEVGPARLASAVEGARAAIADMDDRTLLGVLTFAGSTTVRLPATRMDAAGRAAATAALEGLTAAGPAALGQALLDTPAAVPPGPFAARTVTLLASGRNTAGPAVAAALPGLVGLRVEAEGLLDDPGALPAVAEGTGGSFETASGDLVMQVVSRFARGGGASLLAAFEGSGSVVVDAFPSEVAFLGEGGAMTLVRPDGQGVDLSSPPPGVRVVRSGDVTRVTVVSPDRGAWTVGADEVLVFALDRTLEFTAEADEETVAFPAPPLVRAWADAGALVAGAEVTAEVERPDGSTVALPLFDDGLAIHGDDIPGDGVYSAYLVDLPSPGAYAFVVQMRNVTGTWSQVHLEDEPGVEPLSGPVAPFTRLDVVEVEVGGSGLAIVPPGNLMQETTDPRSIRITWEDTNPGRAAYVVERSTSPDGPWETLAVLPAGATSYTDAPGFPTTFFYRVIARVPGDGDSAPSDEEEVDFLALAEAFGTAGGGGGASAGGGGCFVATAAWGSPLHPRVQALRDFRDEVLLETPLGTAFVAGYYRWSPPAAAWIAERPAARFAARVALTPVVLAVAEPGWLVLALVCLLAYSRRSRAARRCRRSPESR